jgi:hypothetical protein
MAGRTQGSGDGALRRRRLRDTWLRPSSPSFAPDSGLSAYLIGCGVNPGRSVR